jgi:hypothetical protein
MSADHEINVPVLLHGQSLVHAAATSAAAPTTTITESSTWASWNETASFQKDAAEQPVKAQKTPQKGPQWPRNRAPEDGPAIRITVGQAFSPASCCS